jgi:chaperonin GroEL
VLKRVSEKDGPYGFNAETGEYGDMMQMGIIDPAKVVRSALENGASVARVLLSTACLIAEKPKEKKAGPGGPPAWAAWATTTWGDGHDVMTTATRTGCAPCCVEQTKP